MESVVALRSSPPARQAGGVILAGLAGGMVDFLYAQWLIVSEGRSFQKFWQGVAKGWGRGAADDGWLSTGLGLATHFGIAIVMAAVFAVATRRASILRRQWLPAGVIYGLGLYLVMYWVVLPLRWPKSFPPAMSPALIPDALSHLGVGVAIAFVLARWAVKRAART